MRIRSHSCNENEFNGKVVGSKFWACRWWLYLGKRTISAEWYLLNKAKSHLSAKMEFGHGDGDDGIMFHVAIPWLFSVFISLDGVFGRIFRYPNEPRETGVAFHNGSFWLYPFSKTNSWQKKDGWFSKNHSFDPMEFVCGRWNYTEEHVTPWSPIVVGMPEGTYKGKVKLYIGTWKNRFRTRRVPRAEIDMEEGIPFPGKGENSWDCDENCTWGLTCAAKSEEEAIASIIEGVLRNRRVYGSRGSVSNYTPTRKFVRNEVGKQDSAASATESCEAAN